MRAIQYNTHNPSQSLYVYTTSASTLDISDMFITDDVDAAYNFLIDKLTFKTPTTTGLNNSQSMNSFINK